MANISNKNINTLVEDFIRNPKKFESYIKHCLNTLKNYNWLRTNQFNKDINDYDYFMKMYRYIGFGLFDFSFLYEEYRNYYPSLFQPNDLQCIDTNIFYYDYVSKFLESLGYTRMIEGTSTESKIVRLKRMKCIIYPIDVQLDNKVYTFEELFNLIMGNSIVIVDTTTESDEMSEEQFTIGVNSGEIVLNKTALCSIGLDDKAFSDFVSSANEEERKLWYAMNMFFCKYLREDKLKFESTNQVCVIKGDEEFRNTVNHINEIISTIKKRYKRSKKTIPNLFSNIFDLVDREIREAEKEFYTSNSRNRIKDE